MMLSKPFAQGAIEELDATDFATPAHQLVFSAIQKLLRSRMAVDAVMVVEQLRADEQLKEIGGAPFLHSLIEGAPSVDAAEHYLEIVRHTAILRGDRQEPASALATRATYWWRPWRTLNDSMRSAGPSLVCQPDSLS